MLNWFYYNIMKRIQGARNGNEKDNETITKRISSATKDERWSDDKTNCIRLEFKSEDSKHIQAKNLAEIKDRESMGLSCIRFKERGSVKADTGLYSL